MILINKSLPYKLMHIFQFEVFYEYDIKCFFILSSMKITFIHQSSTHINRTKTNWRSTSVKRGLALYANKTLNHSQQYSSLIIIYSTSLLPGHVTLCVSFMFLLSSENLFMEINKRIRPQKRRDVQRMKANEQILFEFE